MENLKPTPTPEELEYRGRMINHLIKVRYDAVSARVAFEDTVDFCFEDDEHETVFDGYEVRAARSVLNLLRNMEEGASLALSLYRGT